MLGTLGERPLITSDAKQPLLVAAGEIEFAGEPIDLSTRLARIAVAVAGVRGGDGSIRVAVDWHEDRLLISASAPCVIGWIACGV